LRSYIGHTPKALTYMDSSDTPKTSYYRTHRDSTRVVVVEDIPSAVRASRYVNAVALLGTSCSVEAAWEMAQVFSHVVWALDKDAVRQAYNLQRTHAIMFTKSDVLRLERDLKDETEERLEAILFCTRLLVMLHTKRRGVR